MRNKDERMIVVFDFDGVICDSTEECLITGYNAWLEYQKKDGFVTKAAQIPPGLVKYFRRLRGMVRTAGQYFAIFKSYGSANMEPPRPKGRSSLMLLGGIPRSGN